MTPPEPLMFMDDETEELVKALVLVPVQALSKRLESMSIQTKTSQGAENTYHIFTQSDMEPYLEMRNPSEIIHKGTFLKLLPMLM